MESKSEVVPSCLICGSTSVVPSVSNKFVGEDESQVHLTALFILTKVLNTPEPELNRLLGQKESIADVLMSTCGACEKSLRQYQNTLKLMSRFEKRLSEIQTEIKDRVRESLDKVKLGGTGSKELKKGGGGGGDGGELNGGHHQDPEVLGAMDLAGRHGVVAVADDIPITTPVQTSVDPFAKFCIETDNIQQIDEEYKICIEYGDEELDTFNDNLQDGYAYQDVQNIASAQIQQGSSSPPVLVREHIPVPIQISLHKRPCEAELLTEIKDRVRDSLDKVKLGGTGSKELKQGGECGAGGGELNGGHPRDPEVLGAMDLAGRHGVVAVADDIPIPTPIQPCDDPFAKFCIETGDSQPIDEEYKICIEFFDEEVDACPQDNHQDSYDYQDLKSIASSLKKQGSSPPPVLVREDIPGPIQISSDKRPFILYANTEISFVDPESDYPPPNPIKIQKGPKLKTTRKLTPLDFVGKKKKYKHEPPHKCYQCPFRSPSKLQLDKHSLLHGEGATAVICSDCGWYVRQNMLNVHRVRRHPNVKTPGLEQSRKYSYNCQVCPFKTTNDVDFRAHWESHYPSLSNRTPTWISNQQGKKAMKFSSPINLGDKPDNANETQVTVGSSASEVNGQGSRE